MGNVYRIKRYYRESGSFEWSYYWSRSEIGVWSTIKELSCGIIPNSLELFQSAVEYDNFCEWVVNHNVNLICDDGGI